MQTDKCYDLLEVQKVVLTSTYSKLLTFTATEQVMTSARADFDSDVDGHACVKTIQAMVHEGFDYSLELEQWRYKPVNVAKEEA